MTNSLEQHLLGYDGKATSTLSEARVACKEHPKFFQDLATFCIDPRPKISEGATWILKAELESGADVPQSVMHTVLTSLENIQSWQAVLHIFQSVDHFKLTPDQSERLLDWAKLYTSHTRPFLRAWSLHVLVILSLQHPEHAGQIPSVLKAADEDIAASVRARARNLRKKLAITKHEDK